MTDLTLLPRHGKVAAACQNCGTFHFRDRTAFATFKKSDRSELCFACADGGKIPRRPWEMVGWGRRRPSSVPFGWVNYTTDYRGGR